MPMGEIGLVCWADGCRNRKSRRSLRGHAIEDVYADFVRNVWVPLLRPLVGLPTRDPLYERDPAR